MFQCWQIKVTIYTKSLPLSNTHTSRLISCLAHITYQYSTILESCCIILIKHCTCMVCGVSLGEWEAGLEIWRALLSPLPMAGMSGWAELSNVSSWIVGIGSSLEDSCSCKYKQSFATVGEVTAILYQVWAEIILKSTEIKYCTFIFSPLPCSHTNSLLLA